VGDKEEVGEVAAEARCDAGAEHLHGDRVPRAVALDLAAMHLRDGRRRNRRPQAHKRLCDRALQRRCDHGFGVGLRKRRQPVLQGFEIARHADADHVGPGGQELPKFQVGGAHALQRARQPRAGLGAGAFDQPRDLQCKLARRRHQRRIDHAEHAFTREHETGAGKPRDVRQS